MKLSNEEYLRKLELVSSNIKYFELIQEEVDRVSHIINNSASLEWRLTYKVAASIERGFNKYYTIKSVIKKAIAAELNKTTHGMARHATSTFSSLERNTSEGDIVSYEVTSPVDIEEEYLRNETIKLVFDFASNEMERAMVNGMLDGLTDAEIGRRISELDDNKYTLQAYRKAVRKFRLRCADALRTEV